MTLGLIIALELFSQAFSKIPNIILLLQIIVLYAAFRNGVIAGLQAAILTWIYAVYYLTVPGQGFNYKSEDVLSLATASVTMPLIAAMVGVLKYRAELRSQEKLKNQSVLLEAKILQKSERQYRLLFEKNLQPMWVFDAKTLKFLAVNEAAIKKYGFTKKDFLRMTIKDIRPVEDIPVLLKNRRKTEKSINKLLSGDFAQAGEWRHLTKDNKIINVEIAITPIYFRGKIARLVLINDITERKALEALKNQFISTAAHELKTPLTTLKLLIESNIARYKKKMKGIKINELQLIDQELNRLNILINDLLDISRIETGKLKFNFERVILRSLVQNVVYLMRKVTNKHSIIVHRLPNIIIQVDKDRIKQVLINLINNALEYSPEGGKIEVSSKLQKTSVVVDIKDHGIGITKGKLPFVFDRFYQIQETGKGFGLGLYITKEIIKRHGGRIWVESNYGKGSAFHFSLPLK